MRLPRLFLPGLLLLNGFPICYAQTAPAPGLAAEAAEPAVAAPRQWLVKVGLNPGRAFRNGDPTELRYQLPMLVGAEYSLGPTFSLYGQVDADLRYNRAGTPAYDRVSYFPTGAASIGVRCYYNQAGRARQNRAYGPFTGNYLALEAHTETRRFFASFARQYQPSLNLIWGMQRQLGRHFLFDLNAGAGLGQAPRLDVYNLGGLIVTTQLNLGLYFRH